MNDNPSAIDASEDLGVNTSTAPTISDLVAVRLSRRDALKGLMAGVAVSALGPVGYAADALANGGSSFTFKEIPHGIDQTHHVAEGYDVNVLIRWGDRLTGDALNLEGGNITAAAQEKAFGYNNDFLAYFPLPLGSKSSDHGILAVNHEYTNTNLMFAGIGEGRESRTRANLQQCEAELAAHGLSMIEVRKTDGRWSVVDGSRYNRRVTGTSRIDVSGPAAGHDRMKTSADATGKVILGTLNNCAGGWTPWGTYLTGEENFNGYFGGDAENHPNAAQYKRLGITKDAWYAWPQHIARFNVEKEPNEPNRFGWVVEVDPYDPASVPVKRTALGRFKHEGAMTALSPDGRLVVYSGDDERNEYVYKFVTAGRYNPNDRAANRDLLDTGTLYVAQFDDEGGVKWIPLTYGEGPLTAANGFSSQADVVIEARRAADLVKATPMDRPEDVEVNPVSGRVVVLLTNNIRRTPETVNKANPRPNNQHGQILEIIPPGGAAADHAATTAKWEMFLVAGKPGTDAGTAYHPGTSENGWLSCPDMAVFDSKGRLWIGTDGAPTAAKIADGLYATDTTGPGKALTKLFFACPAGAEMCGPCLTPDDQTMFLAVQHPGEDPGSTFEKPSTRWPDFNTNIPPRPSIVVVTKRGGGIIGS